MMDRLSQFEDAMTAVDASRAQLTGIIEVSHHGGLALEIDGLSVRLPDGSDIAGLPLMALQPGDRVLVTGPSGSGKSTLFRALTGLWPSGSGRVDYPNAGDVLVMPQRPYFPLGTLRRAIAYPLPDSQVKDAQIAETLSLVGLPHLADRLDEEADWSELLSGGEQQRIGIARALLRKPSVLLFDEPVAALADIPGRDLYRILLDRLPETIVLTIDRREVLRDFHDTDIALDRGEVSVLTKSAPLASLPA